MRHPLAAATLRTSVPVPLGFADGFTVASRVITFRGLVDSGEHVAVALGEVPPGRDPLVRIHSECLTGDVFGSARCDCGAQLRESVERIAEAGGYLLYLRQEGRGIGLYAKLDAYALQDGGLDTYEANEALGFRADARDYTVAAQMIRALGRRRVSLLSNNPDKVAQLERLGITVVERVSTGVHWGPANARYLATKAARGAHLLEPTALLGP